MNWTTLFKKFTNWKYFIWILTVILLSIGSYTNAANYEFTALWTNYSPNNFVATTNLNLSDYSCNLSECRFIMEDLDDDENTCYSLLFDWNILDNQVPYRCTEWHNIRVNTNEYPFSTIKFSDWNTWQNWGNIIQWWTENFTPIITKLINIASEFIPYMIYIVVACLWVTLAFKALKYIIWYLQRKAKWAVRWK